MTQISRMSGSLLTASAIPAVLVAGATAMQNCTFPSLADTITVATIFAPTHGGMVRLSWPGWLVSQQDGLSAWSPIPLLTRLNVEQLH